MNMFTWKCEVCRATRNDEDIAVTTKQVGPVTRNVKFCRDNPACFKGANKILSKFNAESLGLSDNTSS